MGLAQAGAAASGRYAKERPTQLQVALSSYGTAFAASPKSGMGGFGRIAEQRLPDLARQSRPRLFSGETARLAPGVSNSERVIDASACACFA